jgi:hypothetical protein
MWSVRTVGGAREAGGCEDVDVETSVVLRGVVVGGCGDGDASDGVDERDEGDEGEGVLVLVSCLSFG